MPQTITQRFQGAARGGRARDRDRSASRTRCKLHGRDDVVFVDIRDPRELRARGQGCRAPFHCPRGMLEFWIDPESPYHKPIFARGQALRVLLRRRLALGARRATAQDMGLKPVAHMRGGFGAWKNAGGPVEGVEAKRKE